eukprot:163909_1
MSNNNRDDNNEDDDENYRDPEDKWSGFHFTRVTCVSILILVVMIVALILDSLSVWGKRRKCSYWECQEGYCGFANCGGDIDSCTDCEDTNENVQCCRYSEDDGSVDYTNKPTCEANGDCGWRVGTTKWIWGGHPDCPTPPGSSNSWTETFNYADLCYDDDDDEACMAMDGGNVYLAFTIFAIIFNAFALCIIAPLYCRDRSLFPCEFCDDKTHWVLGVLYLLCVFCNLIPVIVWLGAADGGMCDNADPYANDAFVDDTINYPGYSTGGLMICAVGHIVTTCAVCCCWGDNRRYGDERDTAKVDRQKEKEKYREEQEMQQNQQNQYNDNQQYNNNNNDQYDNNQQNQYNDNNQYNNNQQQYDNNNNQQYNNNNNQYNNNQQ